MLRKLVANGDLRVDWPNLADFHPNGEEPGLTTVTHSFGCDKDAVLED